MNLLSWNVRGVGSAKKSGVVRKIVRENRVLFLGLVETKSSILNEHSIRNFWVDDEFHWAKVDAMNTSGGLLCVWAKKFITETEVQIGDR